MDEDQDGPERPFAFAHLRTEFSGNDDVRWWYAALWYGPILAITLGVGLFGPFHGLWRPVAALLAGALAYVAIFVVFVVAASALGLILAYRSHRLFKKGPRAHYEKITGKPWPPGPDDPPDLSQSPQ